MTTPSTQTIRSACRLCHGVHQVLVHLEGERVVKVSSDPDSLLGGICPKGVASTELLYHPDRLRYPLRRVGERGENQWEPISWDEALDEMAARLSTIKQESGAPPEWAVDEESQQIVTTGRARRGFMVCMIPAKK